MIQDDNKGLLIKSLPSMKNIKLENNWDQVVLEIFPKKFMLVFHCNALNLFQKFENSQN